jgi:pimeloyl-ACP methyl ester carboxylesterase
VRHWEERFAVVAPDQRGHGESPRFTPDQLAAHPGELMVDDVVMLLEQLPRTPVVIGHSLGGAVALAAAVRRPELFRALVLEDPAPRAPDEPQRDAGRMQGFIDGVHRSLAAPDDESLQRQRHEDHPGWPESELLVTGRAEQQMDLGYLRHGDVKPVSPWTELFPALTVPTLVVSGGNLDEVVVTEEMGHALSALGPPVAFERLEDAGHCVRRDQPERYYALVDGWLRSTGSSPPS